MCIRDSHHTHSVQFDYSAATNVLTLSDYAARHLHGPQTQQLTEATSQYFFSQDDMRKLQKLLHATTPQNPEVKMRAQLPMDGKYRWFRAVSYTHLDVYKRQGTGYRRCCR